MRSNTGLPLGMLCAACGTTPAPTVTTVAPPPPTTTAGVQSTATRSTPPTACNDPVALAVPRTDRISFFAGSKVSVWDPASESVAHLVEPQGKIVTAIHVPIQNRNARLALTTAADGSATLWDLDTKNVLSRVPDVALPCEPVFAPWVRSQPGHAFPYGCDITRAEWTDDGRRLSLFPKGKTLVLNTADGSEIASLPRSHEPRFDSLSPDGRVLLRAHDGLVEVVSVDGPRTIMAISDVEDTAWAPDGSSFVAFRFGQNPADRRTEHHKVMVSKDGVRVVSSWKLECIAASDWSPDGAVIHGVTGPGCKGLPPMHEVMLDAQTGRLIASWPEPYGTCSQPAWLPGGRAYVDGEQAITLFDGRRARALEQLDPSNDEGCLLWWRPASKQFATSYRLWDFAGPITTWQKPPEPAVMASAVGAARWNESGTRFGLLQDGRFFAWSVPDGNLIMTDDDATDAHWLEDGSLVIVAASAAGTLKWIQAEGTKLLHASADCDAGPAFQITR